MHLCGMSAAKWSVDMKGDMRVAGARRCACLCICSGAGEGVMLVVVIDGAGHVTSSRRRG